VALSVDTFEGDPISRFRPKAEDNLEMGRIVESLKLPTVFVLEGGYDVEPIGQNVANVPSSFEG
jgi:acetoin utilization deacetylase AcuC-like enzyme